MAVSGAGDKGVGGCCCGSYVATIGVPPGPRRPPSLGRHLTERSFCLVCFAGVHILVAAAKHFGNPEVRVPLSTSASSAERAPCNRPRSVGLRFGDLHSALRRVPRVDRRRASVPAPTASLASPAVLGCSEDASARRRTPAAALARPGVRPPSLLPAIPARYVQHAFPEFYD